MKVQSLRAFGEELIECGFLFSTMPIATRKAGRYLVVEVGNTSKVESDLDLGADAEIKEGSTKAYLEIVRESRYSWLLFDGSVIQLVYKLKGGSVVAHRFTYVPAPVELDLRDENALLEFEDIVENANVRDPLNQLSRAALRFECDPDAQGPRHPTAHVHLNSPDCRIPMRSAITVREFIFFLMHFFYSQNFDASAVSAPNFSGKNLLSDEEGRLFHLGWRVDP